MNYIIEICVGIDIAILGLAYPVILDKTTNIGNRYKSNYLSIIFENEFPQFSIGPKVPFRRRALTLFELLLFVTICSFILLVFNFPAPSNLLVGSNKLVVFILSLALVASFIIWLDKVALYNGKPTKLLSYLIDKYDSEKKESPYKTYLLKTINEIASFAIQSEDPHLINTFVSFP